MNVAALIFALAGSALSVFQPVMNMLFRKLSVFDILTSGLNDPSMKNICTVVMIVAIIGVLSGLCAFFRNGISVAGLGGCAVFYGWVITSFLSETARQPEFRMLMNIALSWQETLLLWAGCYLIAAVCAFADYLNDSFNNKNK